MLLSSRIESLSYRIGTHWLKQLGYSRKYLHTRHGLVHYFDVSDGGSGPPVVMLHGIGADGLSYARLMHMLRSKHRRIISLESLGHGASDAPGNLCFMMLLEAMADALGQLSLSELPIILGNSMGGGMALWYATEYPGLVGGLVLASPAGAPLVPTDMQTLVRGLSLNTLADSWDFIQRLLYRPNLLFWPLAPLIRARFLRPTIKELVQRVVDAPTMTREKLASLDMPTHVVWGRGDGILPAACAEFYETYLPSHAVFEYVEGVGHSPQLESPRLLADCVDKVTAAIRTKSSDSINED